ncbi:MAG: DNA translocase FtsK, partial [Rhizobiaceae bacterium]|nr:DNA translocase FtsK [Rhizobiaceae bacterium]
MARSIPADYPSRTVRFTVTSFLWRQAKAIAGVALLVLLGLAVAALSTWNVLDPSYSNATSREPANILGTGGSYFADMMMQFFGLGAVLALLPVFAWSLMMVLNVPVHRIPQRVLAWTGGSVFSSAALSCLKPPVTWPIPNGLGGVFGDLILKFPALFIGAYPESVAAIVVGAFCAVPALGLLAFAANLVATSEPEKVVKLAAASMPVKIVKAPPAAQPTAPIEEDEDERYSPFTVLQGYAAHALFSVQARLRRMTGLSGRKAVKPGFDEPVDLNDEEFGLIHDDDRRRPAPKGHARIEPSMFAEAPASVQPRRVVSAPPLGDEDDPPFDLDLMPRPSGILAEDDDGGDWAPVPGIRAPMRAEAPAQPAARRAPRAPAAASRPDHRPPADADGFDLPPLELLAEPKSIARDPSLSNDALAQNARILEGVLEDFGVKGNIIHVRPGPVVTLYELEPAPGIKSSRVIGLADDIARSMSAIAARVAVVPGRNAIGIELPNRTREMVYFREMIGSRDFDQTKAKLAVALGKTIGGEPVVADLAKMPH